MARGVTRRPAKRALRPIEIAPMSTSALEHAQLKALHERTTQKNKISAEPATSNAASGHPVIAGQQVGGKMRIRGGAFGPKSNNSFI